MKSHLCWFKFTTFLLCMVKHTVHASFFFHFNEYVEYLEIGPLVNFTLLKTCLLVEMIYKNI